MICCWVMVDFFVLMLMNHKHEIEAANALLLCCCKCCSSFNWWWMYTCCWLFKSSLSGISMSNVYLSCWLMCLMPCYYVRWPEVCFYDDEHIHVAVEALEPFPILSCWLLLFLLHEHYIGVTMLVCMIFVWDLIGHDNRLRLSIWAARLLFWTLPWDLCETCCCCYLFCLIWWLMSTLC